MTEANKLTNQATETESFSIYHEHRQIVIVIVSKNKSWFPGALCARCKATVRVSYSLTLWG